MRGTEGFFLEGINRVIVKWSSYLRRLNRTAQLSPGSGLLRGSENLGNAYDRSIYRVASAVTVLRATFCT